MTLSRRNFLRSAGALVGIVAAEPVRRVFDMGANVRSHKDPASSTVYMGQDFGYGDDSTSIWMSSEHGFTYDTGSPQGTFSLEGSADGERWHGIDETGPIPEQFVRAKWDKAAPTFELPTPFDQERADSHAEHLAAHREALGGQPEFSLLDDRARQAFGNFYKRIQGDMDAAFEKRLAIVRGV